MSTNGHKLVLFDIDGTLLSAGRAARESILSALQGVYGWSGSGEGHDFSGKTDPQIIRELIAEALGGERCEADLERALEAYLAELDRRLVPELVVTKPGIADLLARLAADPRVTLGLLTGNLERGARMKLAFPDFNRYFPFGAFGSDSPDRYRLPPIALERARSHSRRDFSGKSIVIVGDSIHDVLCGRDLGVKAVAVATGPTKPERLAAQNPDALLESFADLERGLEAILS
ncbi:MAG TPA: HAD family hydrolase [Thermoanaerobaculia bacterium]|jgi:phosphoglycolate phosphatase|nr:HAD family hydrolase [Thermoanaerobaculia bacterium]